MYSVLVEFTIAPGKEKHFLDWKRQEAALHAISPGFVSQSLMKDLEKPNTYYFSCTWATKEDHNRYLEHPDFAAGIDASGVREAIASRTIHLVEVLE